MDNCDKHGPYSTFCRMCDLEPDPLPNPSQQDVERKARGLLQAQYTARGYADSYVETVDFVSKSKAVAAIVAALSAIRLDEEVIRAALEPFAEVADWAERNGHDLVQDYDMLLRGPEGITGHLHAQAEDFVRARQTLSRLSLEGGDDGQ